MKLTIGMPVYRDLSGPWSTVSSLRLHHGLAARADAEIVVVDNAPDSAEGAKLREWCALGVARYVPLAAPVGPAAAKDLVFAAATGDVVACLDSHVLLLPGAVAAVEAYFAARPDSLDLVSGPQIFDHGQISTHLARVWGAGMLGQWALAWRSPAGELLSPRQLPEDTIEWRTVSGDRVVVDQLRYAWPTTGWAGHEARLVAAGWQPIGSSGGPPEPLEVPAFGQGFFACRRAAWPKYRDGDTDTIEGFAGEEWMIHDEVRRRGGRCVCLPQARWNHRYLHLERDKSYRREWYDRVRTYLLWGRRLSYEWRTWLDELRREFVDGGLLDGQSWDYLLEDPVSHVRPAGRRRAVRGPVTTAAPALTIAQIIAGEAEVPTVVGRSDALTDLYALEASSGRPIARHLDLIRDLASRCDHVTECSSDPATLVAILAGGPQHVRSYSTGAAEQYQPIHAALAAAETTKELQTTTGPGADSLAIAEIDETDMLVLHTGRAGLEHALELQQLGTRARRYLVVTGTLYGERARDGKSPGVFASLRPWAAERLEWRVLACSDEADGIVVLGCDPHEYPDPPVHAWDPGYGPGTELRSLLREAGIETDEGCSCRARMRQMNRWDVAGCRANRATITGWLRDGLTRWSWGQRLPAAIAVMTSRLAWEAALSDPWEIVLSDPLTWLVGEAIRRAEATARPESQAFAPAAGQCEP